MPNLKYPLAVWQDPYGNYTVSTLDGLTGTSVATELNSAINALVKFLNWKHKRLRVLSGPEFVDPQVQSFKVTLRGVHVHRRERFPNEYVSQVPFQAVVGKRSDGSLRCVFPKLQLSFSCSSEKLLTSMGTELLRDHFSRLDPREIARAASFTPIELEYANVSVDEPQESVDFSPLTRTLQEVAVNLNGRGSGKTFEMAWARASLVKQLTSFLQNRGKNVLLLGPQGVGKTTLLAEAARSLRKQFAADKRAKKSNAESDSSDEEVQTRPISCWLTNASRLISGMQYLGQWEERCEEMVGQLAETNGILCIENLLDLILTGQEPSSSIAAFFRGFMLSDELRMVAEVTPRELETVRRLLPGFDSLFEILRVKPLDENASIDVLGSIAKVFEQNRKLETAQQAMGLTVQLFRRFLPYDPFPGKCVGFWRRLCQKQIEQARREKTVPRLDVEHVVAEFSKEMSLSEFLIRDEVLLTPEQVRQHFTGRVIGQTAATEAMTKLVLRIKSAMTDPQRPIAVYLFCGPTGVGKTELAKVLADYLFSSEFELTRQRTGSAAHRRLIRLDMSEYSSYGSAQRLLTKPNGSPSQLIEQIRLHPFSVVLLDEIEKGSPDVFDALMNVFDEGTMSDSLGRETSFCSAVFIMTSNLGSQVPDSIGFGDSASEPHIKEVKKFFRPEFFNRLDGVINFRHLSPEDILRITKIELQNLARREGLEKRLMQLDCSEELIAWLADKGYDRRLGARPMQRVIEAHVTRPLAHFLAAHPTANNRRLRLVLVEGHVVLET